MNPNVHSKTAGGITSHEGEFVFITASAYVGISLSPERSTYALSLAEILPVIMYNID